MTFFVSTWSADRAPKISMRTWKWTHLLELTGSNDTHSNDNHSRSYRSRPQQYPCSSSTYKASRRRPAGRARSASRPVLLSLQHSPPQPPSSVGPIPPLCLPPPLHHSPRRVGEGKGKISVAPQSILSPASSLPQQMLLHHRLQPLTLLLFRLLLLALIQRH